MSMQFHRGVIRAYDATNHRADVLLVGSMSRVVLGVAVAHQIGPELVVEGAACGVLFFAEGASGVVVCTFEGTPDPWVTSALIKDGEVAPTDLSFCPATPRSYLKSTSTDQNLTTSAAVYDVLSQEVEMPSGKTFGVMAAASVEFECTAWTGFNIDLMQLYRGSTSLGQPQGRRHNGVSERGSSSLVVVEQITASATYSVKVWKSQDRNTEVAHRGNLALLYWEAT